MSNHVVSGKVWLIGAGNMAVDYCKVLQAQKVDFEVIGRGQQSAESFTNKTGMQVKLGGLNQYLSQSDNLPNVAIVAVSVEQLTEITIQLLEKGIKRILVEKPAGLDLEQIEQVAQAAEDHNAEVYVAYNRRFYSSVLKAQEIIEEDGGVKSFNFEFTEWSHVIGSLDKDSRVKENWFLANSTHVIDLAFYLGGMPREISCYTAGGLEWHPSASIFAGAGIAENGVIFSYQANWQGPGRWGVEMITPKHRLIFRPLEKLQIQRTGSVAMEEIEIDDTLDQQFKPGIYKQVEAMLTGNRRESLLTIDNHKQIVEDIYSCMSGKNTTAGC